MGRRVSPDMIERASSADEATRAVALIGLEMVVAYGVAGVLGLVVGSASVACCRLLGSLGTRIVMAVAIGLLTVAAVATAFGSDVTGFQFVERRPTATQAALVAAPALFVALFEFARLQRRSRRADGLFELTRLARRSRRDDLTERKPPSNPG